MSGGATTEIYFLLQRPSQFNKKSPLRKPSKHRKMKWQNSLTNTPTNESNNQVFHVVWGLRLCFRGPFLLAVFFTPQEVATTTLSQQKLRDHQWWNSALTDFTSCCVFGVRPYTAIYGNYKKYDELPSPKTTITMINFPNSNNDNTFFRSRM